jgi:hypothetical protein
VAHRDYSVYTLYMLTNRQKGARAGAVRWADRWQRAEASVEGHAPHLVPLYRRIYDAFGNVTPDERFNRFVEYAEEHEGEVLEALQRSADKQVEALLRDRKREDRRVAEFVETFKDESDDVPF